MSYPHIPIIFRPSQFAAALSVPIDTSFSGPCAGLCREGQRESGAPRGEECLLLGTDLENIYVWAVAAKLLLVDDYHHLIGFLTAIGDIGKW